MASSRPGSTDMSTARLPELELITFYGTDTEDVTAFLQNVSRVAFAQGRQRDDQWLVEYAETCLMGSALRWFCRLDDENSKSWKSLRRAFLDKYGAAAAPQASAAPAPAPAPAAAPPPQTRGDALQTDGLLPSQVYRQPANHDDFLATAIVIGAPGVGKSSLLSRIVGHEWKGKDIHYEFFPVKIPPNPGKTAYRTWERHIWEIPGSYLHDPSITRYRQGVEYVWLVYDITDEDSLKQASEWQRIFDKNTLPNFRAGYLIAHKCDRAASRVVSEMQGRRLANSLGFTYLEASARTNVGVQGLRGGWCPLYAV